MNTSTDIMNPYSENILYRGFVLQIYCDCTGPWAVHIGDESTRGFLTKGEALVWAKQRATVLQARGLSDQGKDEEE